MCLSWVALFISPATMQCAWCFITAAFAPTHGNIVLFKKEQYFSFIFSAAAIEILSINGFSLQALNHYVYIRTGQTRVCRSSCLSNLKCFFAFFKNLYPLSK